MVAFDWQVMTSYWCSIVTSGASGTVVQLQTVSQQNRNPKKKKEEQPQEECCGVSIQPLSL